MAANSTSATNSGSGIILYDIAFAQPHEKNSSAPNPWKARYALNFKNVAYSTQWVPMNGIANVRRGLGVPAGRQFADGTDFYTLPILADPKVDQPIGDSFDIALHLQTAYPGAGSGDLFPAQKLDFACPGGESLVPLSEQRKDGPHADYAEFNNNVDMVFTLHTILMAHGMKWDPKDADGIKAEFIQRVGVSSWDDLKIEGEAREKTKLSLRDAITHLATMYKRDTTGPFLLGNQASYADIIVGGWLRMMSVTLPEHEWEEAKTWHDGVFGSLHSALQQEFGKVQ